MILLLIASSLGLLPHSAFPQAPEVAKPYIPKQSDKVAHFFIFFALTATFYFILDIARRRVLHITLVVCTLVLGVGSEVVQGLLPNGRDFDAWDVLANVVGSLCAIGLAAAYHRRAAERRRRAKYDIVPGEALDEDDLELGEGPGLSGHNRDDDEGQESGIISVDRPQQKATPAPPAPPSKSVEEELDNWDENQPDDWDDDDDDVTSGQPKMTPTTSSGNSEDVPRKKLAVD